MNCKLFLLALATVAVAMIAMADAKAIKTAEEPVERSNCCGRSAPGDGSPPLVVATQHEHQEESVDKDDATPIEPAKVKTLRTAVKSILKKTTADTDDEHKSVPLVSDFNEHDNDEAIVEPMVADAFHASGVQSSKPETVEEPAAAEAIEPEKPSGTEVGAAKTE